MNEVLLSGLIISCLFIEFLGESIELYGSDLAEFEQYLSEN